MRSSLVPLRLASAALCVQAALAEYFCDEGFDPSSADDGSGSGYNQPHRVAVYVVGVFVLFYGFVMGLFVVGYKALRAGPAERYAEALAAGQIKQEEGQALTEKVARAWITTPISEVLTTVRITRRSSLRDVYARASDPLADVHRVRRTGSTPPCTLHTFNIWHSTASFSFSGWERFLF